MKRDIILSAIISTLATYLPVWSWDGALDRLAVAMGLGVMVFVGIFGTEKEVREDDLRNSIFK